MRPLMSARAATQVEEEDQAPRRQVEEVEWLGTGGGGRGTTSSHAEEEEESFMAARHEKEASTNCGSAGV